jgi:hypothetical protein
MISAESQNHSAACNASFPRQIQFTERPRCEKRTINEDAVNSESENKIRAKRLRPSAPPAAVVDVAYVRRLLRKHRDADRRAAAACVNITPSSTDLKVDEKKMESQLQTCHVSASSNSPFRHSDASGYSDGADTESEFNSDGHSCSYESDCGSLSECSSGCWDMSLTGKMTWPIADMQPEPVACDDTWLDELRAVGSSNSTNSDPWVADWL